MISAFEAGVRSAERTITPDLRVSGVAGHLIHRWFHRGNGTGSARAAARAWREVAEHHDAAAAAIDDAIAKLGESGRGGAGLVAPLRRTVEACAVEAVVAAEAIDAQISCFHEAKDRVVDVGSEPPCLDLSAPIALVNLAVATAEHWSAVRANQDALERYGAATEGNVANLPRFGQHERPSRPQRTQISPQDTTPAPQDRHRERRRLFGLVRRGRRKDVQDAD
ncbi:PPE domain-containing protein [Saccharopolyspora taberi]|uniref:PPE domain-containing protein n=1 Tax=Saccharopolyspora taberi TaxID=60895 RepID=A0ABN3V9Z7_9PSEU